MTRKQQIQEKLYQAFVELLNDTFKDKGIDEMREFLNELHNIELRSDQMDSER